MKGRTLPQDCEASLAALKRLVVPAHHLLETVNTLTRGLALPAGSQLAAEVGRLRRHFRGHPG